MYIFTVQRSIPVYKKLALHDFGKLTTIFVLGVEDVAAPLGQVGQHTENSLNAEL